MKAFRGPKFQGGWVGAAIAAGAAIVGSIQKDKADKRALDQSKEMSAEGFRRQNYLDQQSRKWQLEDRQYKENAIGGFRNYGIEGPTPGATSTAGLADWNPENKPTGGGAMTFGGPQMPGVNPYSPCEPLPRRDPIGTPLLQLAR